MRILVTGGAGFIGSNFCRYLFGTHTTEISKVVVLDKLTYAGNVTTLSDLYQMDNFDFHKGDINNMDLMCELLSETDLVVNFAAESHVDKSINSSKEFVESNIKGVQNILDSILRIKKPIRMVQISTDEVYGSIERGSWSEESQISPNSPYSASKAGGELLAMAYYKTHKMDVCITRCSNNYGKFQFPEKLIPLFVTNLIEGKKTPIYGAGANVRDWLHVEDHCDAVFRVMLNGRGGETYNIGGGKELTNMEITKIILADLGADESSIEYVEDRKGHDYRYSVDWSKIKNELGYSPKVKFEDGLHKTIEWYKNNKDWWQPLKSRVGNK